MTDADQPIAEADPGLAGWEHPLVRLRRALDEDELQLYCQPILSSKISANAVARLKLQAIVKVGAVTGIGIVAECVEEPKIIDDLRKMWVGYAQGFGIAMPRPIETGAFAPR